MVHPDLAVMLNVVFVLYDYSMNGLIVLYIRRLHPLVQKYINKTAHGCGFPCAMGCSLCTAYIAVRSSFVQPFSLYRAFS